MVATAVAMSYWVALYTYVFFSARPRNRSSRSIESIDWWMKSSRSTDRCNVKRYESIDRVDRVGPKFIDRGSIDSRDSIDFGVYSVPFLNNLCPFWDTVTTLAHWIPYEVWCMSYITNKNFFRPFSWNFVLPLLVLISPLQQTWDIVCSV